MLTAALLLHCPAPCQSVRGRRCAAHDVTRHTIWTPRGAPPREPHNGRMTSCNHSNPTTKGPKPNPCRMLHCMMRCMLHTTTGRNVRFTVPPIQRRVDGWKFPPRRSEGARVSSSAARGPDHRIRGRSTTQTTHTGRPDTRYDMLHYNMRSAGAARTIWR